MTSFSSMTKRKFIGSLYCLAAMTRDETLAADSAEFTLDPEKCAAQSPEDIWIARLDAGSVQTSEQTQTRFYEAYAVCLGKWTELKHPKAKQMRSHIHAAWNEAMSFVVHDVNCGVIHVMPRLAAETEWIIWDGLERGYDRGASGRYTHAMISKLLVWIFEANAEGGSKLEDSMGRIEKSLAELGEAEKHLSDAGRKYFRGHLVKTLSHWL